MRSTLFALFAVLGLALCGAAFAQVGQIGGQWLLIPGSKSPNDDPIINETDPVKLQKEIVTLTKQNTALKGQIDGVIKDRDKFKAQVTGFTAKGGKSVKAYCETPTLSRNTAGAQTDCEASGGYRCEAVSGLCHRSCNVTAECAPGFVCDTGVRACTKP